MNAIFARRSVLLPAGLLGIVLIPLTWLVLAAHAGDAPTPIAPAPAAQAAQAQARAAYGRLPLSFEANEGQVAKRAQFIAHGLGYNLFLTADEAVLILRNGQAGASDSNGSTAAAAQPVLRMKMVGAETAGAQLTGLAALPGKINYLLGNDPAQWHTDVPTYAQVRRTDVYPGVDLVYYGNQRQLEYDFIVAPGRDPRVIKLRFQGAARLAVNPAGALRLDIAGGQVLMHKPVLYQTNAAGARREIAGQYVLTGRDTVGFKVGAYDPALPLVIDPILAYGTYLGSGSSETGYGVAVDAQGNAYVTGNAESLAFPTTGQNFVTTDSFSSYVFATKLDPTGSTLVYSTLLGGNGDDHGFGIAVDAAGSAYLTGRTFSTNFPTVNAVRANNNLLKTVNAGGSWSASNAGLGNLTVTSMAIDPTTPATMYAGTSGGAGVYKSADGGSNWNALNTGFTAASALAIDPQTPTTIYATVNSGPSIRVCKSTDGGANWTATSNTLGGGLLYALAIDPSSPATIYAGTFGGVYKTTNGGGSWSLANNGITFFSVYALAIDPQTPATVYASAGSGGVFKSTNGGGNWSQVNIGLTNTTVTGLVIDRLTPATIYAITPSGLFKTTNGAATWVGIGAGLPANPGLVTLTIDPVTPTTIYAGSAKSSVFKSVNGGSNWSTVYTGFTDSKVTALAVNPANPATVYAGLDTQPGSRASSSEAFVTKLNASGNALVYSTYLGGGADDVGNGIAVDAAGSAYVVGNTASTNFLTANPRQATLQGTGDAFVTKFTPAGSALSYSTYLGGNAVELGQAIALDPAGNAYVTGQTSSTDFPTTVGAFQPAKSSTDTFTSDAYVAKLSADGGSLGYATYLGGSNGSEIGYGIAVDSTGNAYVAGQANPSNFPTLHPFQSFGGGFEDAFVTKLNPAGSALVYSSFLGGDGSDIARGIAVDSAGNAYVAGFTDSLTFPVTTGAIKSKSGFFQSTDGGGGWNNDNSGLRAARYNAIAVSSSGLYVGTNTGVFKSTDSGHTWRASNTGLTAPGVTALAIDPQTPTTLYASIGNNDSSGGTKIFKSTNGGDSWTPINNGLVVAGIFAILIDPTTPATLYLAAGNSVIKSTDGGASWTLVYNQLFSLSSLAIDPTNTATLYASANSSAGGIFKSSDGGNQWSNITNNLSSPYAVRVLVDPALPTTLYASTNAGIAKSTDGGASWATILNVGFADLVIDPLHPATLYALSGQLLKTTDGGASWHAINKGLIYGAAHLAIDPLAPATLYATAASQSPFKLDAFITKVNAAGSALAYSTYLGGNTGRGSDTSQETAYGVAVAADGSAYVTGTTRSIDFPSTPDAFQIANRGYNDVFVVKVMPSVSIAGRVTNANGTPQSGVQLTLSGARLDTITTSSDGTYAFFGLQQGSSYTVSAAQPNFSFTPPSQTFNNLTTDQTADFAAAASATPFHTIGGHITAGSTGLAGVLVTLSSTQTAFTYTAADGGYSFTVPDGNNYTLTPALLGFAFSPANQTINNLSAEQTVNFTGTRQPFVVTNTNDHGSGSLRQAMLDAVATVGADTIGFNIPGSGSKTISPTSFLPPLTDQVTIDGTSQPGFAGTPLIELDGTQAGSGGTGLQLSGGNSVVRGLAINRFDDYGIRLNADGNRLEGCIIGLDPTGTVLRGNKQGGLYLGGSNNLIGGTTPAQRNIISGNSHDGITIIGSDNQIKGNYIGPEVTGARGFGNGTGIAISKVNVIGGPEPGARNLISGNGVGINAGSSGAVIQGNFIGTDTSGTAKVGNGDGVRMSNRGVLGGTTPAARNIISGNRTGVNISSNDNNPVGLTFQGNYIGTDVTGTAKLGNVDGVIVNSNITVGGTTAGAGNLISGNENTGLTLTSYNSVSVQGNLIGTDASGMSALGNHYGILVSASRVVIGGAASGARNVISGNETGIQIGGLSFPVENNVVQGNLIGLNATGTAPLPNTFIGVALSLTSDNIIGGSGAGEANTIAFNGRAGFYGSGGVVVSSTAVANALRQNAIFSNVGLGIDFLVDGTLDRVIPNDPGDTDAGANNLQNFPVLSAVTSGANNTSVQGTLNSTPNTTYTVELFASSACDQSGYGEGAQFFYAFQLTTDASGAAPFNVSVPAALAANRALTATATDPAGNTSEFSPCDASRTRGNVQFGTDNFRVLEDVGNASITVERVGGSRGPLSVNYTVTPVTATEGADYSPVSGTLTFADGETIKTFTIPIADDGVTEPAETARLTLSGTSVLEDLGGQNVASLSIFDSNTPLTLAIDVQYFPEGDSGTTDAPMVVNLSAETGRTITTDFYTAPGPAQSGVDYQPVTGTLTFAPGTLTQIIHVPIIGDRIDEEDEGFGVRLTNAVNATFDNPYGVAVILDDDLPPAVSINDVTVTEGNAGTTSAVFNISLSAASGKTASVRYTTANGTATAGSDYVTATSSLFFNPGQTSKNVSIIVNGDTVRENNETFFVNLTVPSNVTISKGQGTCTIQDDDGPAAISGRITDGQGAGLGSVSVALAGTQAAATQTDANGNYSFASLTAGGSYTVTPTRSFYSFNPASANVSNLFGSQTANFTGAPILLTISGRVRDAESNGIADVMLTLGGTQAATTQTDAAGQYVLRNLPAGGSYTVTPAKANYRFDPASVHFDSLAADGTADFTAAQTNAVVQFSAAGYSVNESAGDATLTVTRTGDTSGAVSLDYRTADTDTFTVGCADTVNNHGGAYARCDFATVVGTLQFAAGETSKTITVPVIDDAYVEGNETFQVVLANPAGAAFGAVTNATVTMQDNDSDGAANPIFASPFFVRMQYLDFLSRAPEQAGYNAWLNVLNNCPDVNNNPNCDRINVSQSFFGSPEFQLKGFYVFRFYKLAFNRLPEYLEIIPDMSFVAGATAAEVFQRKAQLATNFTGRAEFNNAYGQLSNNDYVNALLNRYGLVQITTLDPAQPDGAQKLTLTRAALVNQLDTQTLTRAQVLRAIADSDEVGAAEFNNAFVAMQYYGYLRRTPEASGYQAWLRVLQSGDIRTMVNGFMNSTEYRLRFGSPTQ